MNEPGILVKADLVLKAAREIDAGGRKGSLGRPSHYVFTEYELYWTPPNWQSAESAVDAAWESTNDKRYGQ